MKTFWWIYDDFGCMNFFDSAEAFRHARNHIHGLMECDTSKCDRFQAEAVADCWKLKDVMNWKDGVMSNE